MVKNFILRATNRRQQRRRQQLHLQQQQTKDNEQQEKHKKYFSTYGNNHHHHHQDETLSMTEEASTSSTTLGMGTITTNPCCNTTMSGTCTGTGTGTTSSVPKASAGPGTGPGTGHCKLQQQQQQQQQQIHHHKLKNSMISCNISTGGGSTTVTGTTSCYKSTSGIGIVGDADNGIITTVRTSATTTINHNHNHNNHNDIPTTTMPTTTTTTMPTMLILTQDNITAHLHDFFDDLNANKHCKIPDVWHALYEKYHSPNYRLIRPSGNPITCNDFVHMHCSNDGEIISFTLISIDSIQFMAGNIAAVVTYTMDQIFKYKGTLNEDRCVITSVLQASPTNGNVQFCHEHRTTGQPIPKQSRWDAN